MKNLEKSKSNGLLTLERFRELSRIHDIRCISLYIPTHRAGQEVDSRQGPLRLKNRLKELKGILQNMDLNDHEINIILDQFEPMLENIHFWRNQSDGLVIFQHGEHMEFYTVPLHFEGHIYVADHFYLKPLIPLFNDDGKFFMLALSLQNVKFYECSRHAITEVYVEDLVPEKLEEVVGSDFQERSLQHRSGHGGEAGAMFHGQGAGKDDKKQEVEKFLRAVDAGLANLFKKEDAPLVLACVDHYHPLFQQISSYSHVFDENVSGNPDHEDPVLLHEKAWMIVEEYFRGQRKQKVKTFRDHSAGGRTESELEKIVPASVEGRVDTLFVQKGKDLSGLYDQVNRKVIVDKSPDPYHASLYNMSVVHTIRNGGWVYLAGPDGMPLKGTEISALLRY